MFERFKRAWRAFNHQQPRRRVLLGRMYHAAKQGRLTSGWGSGGNTSEDGELATSLKEMRARSRALIRDAGYALRAKVVVVNNVVGPGIGLQANVENTRKELRARTNKAIEDAWREWCMPENCHTGGTLFFTDLERLCMGEVFEAGEIILREHYAPFGSMGAPYALEVIEPERLADDYAVSAAYGALATVRMGVELDRFYRPVAYYIKERHPGEYRTGLEYTDRLERVPAENIIHLRIINRFPQTRGVPWMHAAMRKLNDMDGYSEAEIIAARGAASYMGVIETEDTEGQIGEPVEGENVHEELGLEPGVFERLGPGEKLNFLAPNRPNSGMDPFMRMMLREAAAGIGVSYESLSRDYSQSNYSSSRLALIDDRDLWRTLQGWFVRNLRQRVHKRFLQQAILKGLITGINVEEYAVDPAKFEAARFKCRGWGWIDPAKEVQAYKEAVKAGFTTVADVVAATGDGDDLEDKLEQRRQELDLMEELDLTFDTSPENYEVKDEPAPFGKPPFGGKPGDDEEKPGDEEKPADEEEEKPAAPSKKVLPLRA